VCNPGEGRREEDEYWLPLTYGYKTLIHFSKYLSCSTEERKEFEMME